MALMDSTPARYARSICSQSRSAIAMPSPAPRPAGSPLPQPGHRPRGRGSRRACSFGIGRIFPARARVAPQGVAQRQVLAGQDEQALMVVGDIRVRVEVGLRQRMLALHVEALAFLAVPVVADRPLDEAE